MTSKALPSTRTRQQALTGLRSILIGIFVIIGITLSFPALANGSGESADVSFSMKPKAGSFFKQAYRPAKWKTGVTISTSDPEILPMKKADLSFPGRGQMIFKPKQRMPVCPDSQVGPPPTNVSVPVSTIVARCPKSVIGNGTATFVLNRNNLNPAATLDGYMVVFNGGRQGGDPRIKVYAYSYDTMVGIYTEAKLTRNGKLVFQIPQLTSDSSVSSLNLEIPGRNRQFFLTNQQINVRLPGGRDRKYVKARCSGNGWNHSGTFDLGLRDTDGTPASPTTVVSDSGTAACTGKTGRAKLKFAKAKGPRKLARRGTEVYRVKVRNSGTAKAKRVRIRTGGKWVRSGKRRVAGIPAGKTRTYRVRVGLKGRKARRGKKTVVKFRVTARQSKARTAKVRVRVR